MENKLFYLTNSKLETFENCPYQYKLKYIDWVKPSDKPKAVSFLGNMVHYFINKFLRSDKSYKNFIGKWDKYFRWYFKRYKNEYSEMYRIKVSDLYNRSLYCLDNFNKIYNTFKYDKLKSEYKVECKYNDDILLCGYIDVIYKLGDIFTIHDWKTQKQLSQKDANEYKQQIFFAYLVYKKFGQIPNVYLDHLITGKQYQIEIKEDKFDDLKKRIEKLYIMDRQRNDIEFKKNPRNCFFCGYYRICSSEKKRLYLDLSSF